MVEKPLIFIVEEKENMPKVQLGTLLHHLLITG
jgi:hypothetical protein